MNSVGTTVEECDAQTKIEVFESFMLKLRINVVRDKYAYLLSELLMDIKMISEEQGLSEPLFGNTSTLKRKIIERFPDEIDFFPQGRYLIVHASAPVQVRCQCITWLWFAGY